MRREGFYRRNASTLLALGVGQLQLLLLIPRLRRNAHTIRSLSSIWSRQLMMIGRDLLRRPRRRAKLRRTRWRIRRILARLERAGVIPLMTKAELHRLMRG